MGLLKIKRLFDFEGEAWVCQALNICLFLAGCGARGIAALNYFRHATQMKAVESRVGFASAHLPNTARVGGCTVDSNAGTRDE